MSYRTQVWTSEDHAARAAEHVLGALPPSGSLVLTGGTTAEKIYPHLASGRANWSSLAILFSDERCVPPEDDASNFRMASRLLLEQVRPQRVHRMKGEDDPEHAARAYHDEIEGAVGRGLDLLLLGMGADCHIGAMFPGSPALSESTQLCRAVDRPDGMKGLTLSPPAMLAAGKILLLVAGEAKAGAVARVVNGDEPPDECPARLLAGHPGCTFLLDEAAASRLRR